MRIIWFTDGPPCVGAIHTGQHGTAMPSGAVHPNMYPCRALLLNAGILGCRVSPLARLARDDSRVGGAAVPLLGIRRPGSVPALVDQRALDRKSTRLNSSHLGISYAVFCLKKKTK